MSASIRVAWLQFIIAALCLGIALAPSSAVAQSKAAELRKQIVGDWTLVDVVFEQEGKRMQPFGPNPKGFISHSTAGRFSYILLRSDLPKIASNNRAESTAEENKALATGVLAVYGAYSIDDADGLLQMTIEGSTFPNWNGTQQKRQVTIDGDEMRVVNPTPPRGGGTAYVVWRRVR